jgi:hypothetical protein
MAILGATGAEINLQELHQDRSILSSDTVVVPDPPFKIIWKLNSLVGRWRAFGHQVFPELD